MINSFIKLYFEFLFLFIAVLFLTILLGTFIKNFFTSYNKNVNYFVSATLGFFSVVFLGSIYFTSFKTIYVLPLVFLIFFFKKESFSFKFSFNLIDKDLLSVLFFGMIIFTLNFIRYYSFDINDLFISYCDDIFYGKVANELVKTGIESNRALNSILPTNGISPYHYSELWFSGVWSKIIQVNTIRFHVIFTFSIGTTIVALGLYNLFFGEKTKLFKLIFCFFCTLIVGTPILEIFLNGKVYFIENIGVWISDVFFYPKLFPVYILILFSIHSLKNRNENAFLFILYMMPICYFTYLPGILIFSIGFLIYDFIIFKKINVKHLILFIGLLLIPFFYKIFGINTLNTTFNLSELLGDKFVLTLKSAIFHAFSNPIELFTTYVFYLPLLIYSYFILFKMYILNEKSINILTLLIVSILFSAFISGFLFFQSNSWQILGNFAVPFLNIILSFGFFYLVFKEKRRILAYLVLFYGVGVFSLCSISRFSNQLFFPKVSQYLLVLYNNKEFNQDKIYLYWGDNKINESSITYNGVYSVIDFLVPKKINTWTLNIKIPFTKHDFGNLYPYEYSNFNKSPELFLQSIKAKVSNVILCDAGQENQIPELLKSQFKIVTIDIPK